MESDSEQHTDISEESESDEQPSAVLLSYATDGGDIRLFCALHLVDQGRYVEVGIHRGNRSTTRLFYEHGWSGLVVEPVAELAGTHATKRPRDRVVEAVLGEDIGTTEISFFAGTKLPTADSSAAKDHELGGAIQGTRGVRRTTVDELLCDEPPVDIHFMIINEENQAGQTLAGMDLMKFRPWIIAIERTLSWSSIRTEGSWEEKLFDCDYTFVTFDGTYRYYVAKEKSELSDNINLTPKVCYDFITAEMQSIQTELDRHRDTCKIVQIQLDGTTQRLQETEKRLTKVEAEREVLVELQEKSRGEKLSLDSQLEAAGEELAAAGEEIRAIREYADALNSRKAVVLADRIASLRQRIRRRST